MSVSAPASSRVTQTRSRHLQKRPAAEDWLDSLNSLSALFGILLGHSQRAQDVAAAFSAPGVPPPAGAQSVHFQPHFHAPSTFFSFPLLPKPSPSQRHTFPIILTTLPQSAETSELALSAPLSLIAVSSTSVSTLSRIYLFPPPTLFLWSETERGLLRSSYPRN
jgi:hypothetical protein